MTPAYPTAGAVSQPGPAPAAPHVPLGAGLHLTETTDLVDRGPLDLVRYSGRGLVGLPPIQDAVAFGIFAEALAELRAERLATKERA